MIGVEVGEEDLGERERHPKAHHLALGALATLEQQRLALSLQGQRGDVALHGGPGGGRAEKGDGEHASEYKGGYVGMWVCGTSRCTVASHIPTYPPTPRPSRA